MNLKKGTPAFGLLLGGVLVALGALMMIIGLSFPVSSAKTVPVPAVSIKTAVSNTVIILFMLL